MLFEFMGVVDRTNRTEFRDQVESQSLTVMMANLEAV